MKKKMLLIVSLMCGMSVYAGVNLAAAQEQDKERMPNQEQSREMVQTQNQGHIYGSQLMTEKERMEYRDRLRAAHTEEEREQIRMEHHKQMQDRAREQGMMLPEEPPEGGMGMGRGNMNQGGKGYGGGKGSGMGRGGGRGR